MSGRAARAAKQRKMNSINDELLWKHSHYIIHSPKLIWMNWNDFNKEENTDDTRT